VGSAVGQANLLFDKYFASSLSPGNIAAMQYATKLVGFPQQLFAAAIATVIFPILSAHFAKSEIDGLRSTVFSGLRMTALITIPSAFALIALARPIISVLFERGEFTPGDVVRTAGAMQFYAIGLLGIAASIVLTRCFFAMHDSRTPVVIACGVMVLNVVCSALTVRPFGINGLAASNSIASLVEASILGMVLARRIGFADRALAATSFLSTCVASAAMAIVSSSIATAMWHFAAPFWQHCAVLTLAMVAGALTFLVVGASLHVGELLSLWQFATAWRRPRARSQTA
jgi:putative peptidoglycan lipid II flippase